MSATPIPAAGLAVLSLFGCATPTAPDALRFTPAEGQAHRFEFERALLLTLVDQRETLLVDGEEEEQPDELAAEGSIRSRVEIAFTDTYREVRAGAARTVERHYDRLDLERTESFAYAGQREETARSHGHSGLGEADLRFRLDGDAWRVSFADGSGVPALSSPRPNIWLPTFLPDHTVRPGDTWEVVPETMGALLPLGGLVGWQQLSESEDDEHYEMTRTGDFNVQFLAAMRGSVRCRWRGRTRIDGREVFVVDLRADLATHGRTEEAVLDLEGNLESVSDVDFEYTVEGEVRWDAATLRLDGVSLDGPITVRRRSSHGFEEDDERIELRLWQLYEGTMRIEVTVADATATDG